MQLVYHRGRVPNFGDDLNAELWPALAPGFFDDDPHTGFVGIGTIVGMPCGSLRRLTVFSSGVGYNKADNWRDRHVEYACVRGPISAHLMGLPPDRVITDGAILTPLVARFPKTAASGTGGIVVIPHWESLDYPGWPAAAAIAGYDLLDPRDDPRSVIGRIASARLVLTESMHGAILADTYGVPWRAFATSKNFSVPKWVDWSLSVKRELDVTMVRPPDAGPLLRFGLTIAPFGHTIRLDGETALAQVAMLGTGRPEPLTTRLKGVVKRSPLFRRILDCSPARTAEALYRLARLEPDLSAAALRAELQDRMQERFNALLAEHNIAAEV